MDDRKDKLMDMITDIRVKLKDDQHTLAMFELMIKSIMEDPSCIERIHYPSSIHYPLRRDNLRREE